MKKVVNDKVWEVVYVTDVNTSKYYGVESNGLRFLLVNISVGGMGGFALINKFFLQIGLVQLPSICAALDSLLTGGYLAYEFESAEALWDWVSKK